jgi:hypothetical protein
MHMLDFTECGTSCSKRYGTQTRIVLVKRRVLPTKENVSVVANSTVQDQSAVTKM